MQVSAAAAAALPAPLVASRRELLRELRSRGMGGRNLATAHAAEMDRYLKERLRHCQTTDEVALVALGGYGRGELCPHSDIDLLLLYQHRAAPIMEELTSALLYPLWDAGYEVGHSVRTVAETLHFAGEDVIFQIALLDARLLAGNAELYETMRHRCRDELLDQRRMDFASTLEELRRQRRLRYGGHGYLLEPQLKEGHGGLRDLQTMLWLSQAVFGIRDLEGLVDAGLLRPEEHRATREAWNGLLDLRIRLHWVSGRKNDQLLFEYQQELADELGYTESDGVLAVEHFMRRTYHLMQTIASTSNLLFEHVRDLRPVEAHDRERRLERGIVLRRQRLHLLWPEEISRRRIVLLRLFFQAAQVACPLHPRTWRMVRGAVSLVDKRFCASRPAARTFLALLATTPAPATALETMLDTGLLTAYLPEFSHIVALPQHDLYHIFTVDRHLLQTVTELTRLREEEPEFFRLLEAPEVLFLAALLHDIGKGRGGNHSLLGAELALAIARRLGLIDSARETLAFLIRHHLLLPETALRRDLEDEGIIASLAGTIGTLQRLTMLHLLSMADSRATGPQAWTPWKKSLMGELFLRLKSRLAHAATVPPQADATQGVAWLRRQVLDRIQEQPALHPMAELADKLPAEYLLAHTPEQVLHHLEIRRREAPRLAQLQVLLFRRPAAEGHWSLFFMSRDQPGLLARICGVLCLHNLNVLAAQIATWPDATVADSMEVAFPHDGIPTPEEWAALDRDLNLAAQGTLDIPGRLRAKSDRWHPRNGRQVQRLHYEVLIDNALSPQQTVVEVHGADRPAALYLMARILADLDLNISMAKIATEVEQLIDVFYVTTHDGGKLLDSSRQQELRRRILGIWDKKEG